MTGMVARHDARLERMKAAAGAGYATATDLADWLVRDARHCRSARPITSPGASSRSPPSADSNSNN